MTAPDAVPPGTTVEQLAAALRAYADMQPERAAVELLIGHNEGDAHWLWREPFRACVSWFPADDEGPAMAEVDWRSVAELRAYRQVLPDSGSERAVLAVAVSLASGPLADAATSCDLHNRLLIEDAVSCALGLRGTDR